MRKQLYHLTLADFEEFPVWEFALDEEGVDGQDETTVRPYNTSEVDPTAGLFVVKAKFILNDGTICYGYLTPQVSGFDSIGYIQPIIITASGQINFWHGIIKPKDTEITEYYRKLGKNAAQVFPVKYSSELKVINGPVEGTIDGFMYTVEEKHSIFSRKRE
ncbi:MAG: hypothetical protein ACE14V_14000, partial [bacterium]